MLRIHAWLFVTVLELCVIFAALWLGWFFKARTLTRRLTVLRTHRSDPPVVHAAAGDGAYFTAELVATRAQMDAEAGADPAMPPAPLAFRAEYLELERVFAQGQQRDAAFWDQLRQQLGALLEAYATATPPVTPSDDIAENPDETPAADDENDDPPEEKPQPGTQASVLEEFRNALAALLADQQQNPETREHADKLMRCSRELAMCLSVLEDDNGYLREKLKSAGIMHD
jgi:hypothetical protein